VSDNFSRQCEFADREVALCVAQRRRGSKDDSGPLHAAGFLRHLGWMQLDRRELYPV